MIGNWLRRSFRHKLLLALLLLGTLPAIVLTLVYLRYLEDTIALLQNPGVEALLENSLEFARASIEPFERAALNYARSAAGSARVADAVAHGDSGSAQSALAEVLAAAPGPAVGEAALFLAHAGDGGRPTVWVTASTGDAWGANLQAGLARGARSLTPGAASLDAAAGIVWSRLPLDAAPGWEVAAGLKLAPALAERAKDLAQGASLYRSLRAYKEVRLRSIWAVAAVLFVVLAAASWGVSRGLSRHLTRPIVQLLDGTRRVGAGDYRYRIRTEREDELGRLVDAFNRMGEALEQRTDELRRSERIAAWRDVARGIAHQIKNPLTPIALSVHRLQGLASGSGGPPDAGREDREQVVRDCLETVTHEVETLRRIADEFSRFARLPEPQPRPTDLAALVRSVAELYHARNPRIELRMPATPPLPPIALDPDLTRQAVSNLVKNAIEAMPEGGTLTVAIEPLPDAVRIVVTDTGSGIPAMVRDRLFTPYVTTKAGGTGLGLALAHRMVTDQGGTLEVLTGSERGTTFRIEFPARTSLPEDTHAGAGQGDRTGR